MAEVATDLKVHDPPPELARAPLMTNNRNLGWVSDQVAAVVEGKTPTWWWIAFIPSVLCLMMLGVMLLYQISTGVGVWGNNHPVMWGWDIINFVWWIGIGHAGTLISAILFLLRQRWRTCAATTPRTPTGSTCPTKSSRDSVAKMMSDATSSCWRNSQP